MPNSLHAICIDGDFTEFKRIYHYTNFNMPKEGEVYEVRTDNGKGGITLRGINNPYMAISLNPLLFEEVHFNKNRFVFYEGAASVVPYPFLSYSEN